MGYECGIIVDDKDVIEEIARMYESRGEDFDARYAREEGILFTACGYAFTSMNSELSGRSIRTAYDEASGEHDIVEHDIVPLSALRLFSDAFRRFEATRGGKRILACEDVGCGWSVGDATTMDGYHPGNVYISPEDLSEAKKALSSTGVGDCMWQLMIDERISFLGWYSDIVEKLDALGVGEVGWYGG